MKYHYIPQFLVETQHKITVDIIGAGGTGSHVLTNIAILSYTMKELGKQPLFVRVFDPDIILEHNVGRQAFSAYDIGKNKAITLVQRINHHFGTDWAALPIKYEDREEKYQAANIVITCVDSMKARKVIAASIKINKSSSFTYGSPCYWLDIGNSRKTGQVFLGTFGSTPQPSDECVNFLPSILNDYPDRKDDPNEPSCSMIESLMNQDLFINKIMATYAVNMLWTLFNEFRINYRGIFVNLETLKTSPIML